MKERPILFTPENIRAILEGRKVQTRRVITPQPKFTETCGFSWKGRVYGKSISGGDFETMRLFGHATSRYGIPGDRLWVREGWRTGKKLDDKNATEIAAMCKDAGYEPGAPIRYRLDGKVRLWGERDHLDFGEWGRNRSSRFMPKWAARLWLEVKEVKVERVQDISEFDAKAEGCCPSPITLQDIADVEISDASPVVKEMARILGPGQFTAKYAYRELWDSINGKKHPWSQNPWVWVIGFRRLP